MFFSWLASQVAGTSSMSRLTSNFRLVAALVLRDAIDSFKLGRSGSPIAPFVSNGQQLMVLNGRFIAVSASLISRTQWWPQIHQWWQTAVGGALDDDSHQGLVQSDVTYHSKYRRHMLLYMCVIVH